MKEIQPSYQHPSKANTYANFWLNVPVIEVLFLVPGKCRLLASEFGHDDGATGSTPHLVPTGTGISSFCSNFISPTI